MGVHAVGGPAGDGDGIGGGRGDVLTAALLAGAGHVDNGAGVAGAGAAGLACQATMPPQAVAAVSTTAAFEPRLDLGLAYLSRRRIEGAIGTFSRLIADQEAGPAEDADYLLPFARYNLAITYLNTGQAGTVVRLLEQTVAEYGRMLGANSQAALTARGTLGVPPSR